MGRGPFRLVVAAAPMPVGTLEREEPGPPTFRCDPPLQGFEPDRIFAQQAAPHLVLYRGIALEQPADSRFAQAVAVRWCSPLHIARVSFSAQSISDLAA